MASPGRPSKFNEDTCAIILEKIEAGNFLSIAAQCAGVGSTTFKRWMELGRSVDPKYAQYRAFRAAVKRAKATAESVALERIRVAGRDGTWQAEAWYLERSRKGRWAAASKVQVSGKKGAPIEINATVLNQAGSELSAWRELMTPAPSNTPNALPTPPTSAITT